MNSPTSRLLASLATSFAIAASTLIALAVSPFVSASSAYVLSNGCDEYDPATGTTYRCVPDRTTFYTPDGVNPDTIPVGTEYAVSSKSASPGLVPSMTLNNPYGIPPPAPYVAGRDYCSDPWYSYTPFEGKWQYPCYSHDVCYGSQLGRRYCDARFWRDMIAACKSYSWYDPARYACFMDAATWYGAVRAFGASHYKPRQTNFEPAGT
jgi:hypothetical protein